MDEYTSPATSYLAALLAQMPAGFPETAPAIMPIGGPGIPPLYAPDSGGGGGGGLSGLGGLASLFKMGDKSGSKDPYAGTGWYENPDGSIGGTEGGVDFGQGGYAQPGAGAGGAGAGGAGAGGTVSATYDPYSDPYSPYYTGKPY